MLVALAAALGACSTITAPEPAAAPPSDDGGLLGPGDEPAGSDSAVAGGGGADAGARAPDLVGHPLCRATELTCFPGAEASATDAGLAAGPSCAAPPTAPTPSDAGAAPADASAAPSEGAYGETCRVTSGVPTCASAGPVESGARCTGSDECGRGFDCVLGADGGRCRRYCCTGSCREHAAPNGSTTYCDVAQTAEAALQVPVCLPVRPCRLLAASQCGSSETCTVVDEEGTASCVPIGPAKVDEACDTVHCGAGLACLGAPGRRRCYELCRMGGGCGEGRSCMTSVLFKDPTFGVCQAS